MQPSPLDSLREWLTLAAVVLSAVFAGLIWWLARRRLSTRYRLVPTNKWTAELGLVSVAVEVHNRSDKEITIEEVSVKRPWSILADHRGAQLGPSVARNQLEAAQRVRSVRREMHVPPDGAEAFRMMLAHDDDDPSKSNRVSIALHILKSFPVIRHKKKVLTATLPASIRSAQLSRPAT